jgi:RimJ/RimL family protein N-acetyltransferase
MLGVDNDTFVLRDGREVKVRPMRAGDKTALAAFHDGLSATSQRYRFFNTHPHLSAKELQRFTEVDHLGREALVAWHDGQIVGVGRFDQTGPDRGEVAFVVADAWQGAGLGSLLLDQLGQWAHDRGIHTFVADVLGGNHAMMHVFSRWCPERRTTFEDGCFHVEMPVG